MSDAPQPAAGAEPADVGEIARVHREQRVAERHTAELVESRAVQLARIASAPGGFAGDARARERVPIRVQAVARDADADISFARVLGTKQRRALARADDEAGDVVFAVDVEARHLRGLAAEECGAVLATGEGHARDDTLEARRIELAGGEVIEEEERLGTHDRDVVDAVIDQVLADRVVRIEEIRQAQFRPNAISAGNEDRVGQTPQPEQPTESADLADDLGPSGALDVTLDPRERVLGHADVHAGVAIADAATHRARD